MTENYMQDIREKLDEIIRWQRDHQKYDETIHLEQDQRLGKIPNMFEIEQMIQRVVPSKTEIEQAITKAMPTTADTEKIVRGVLLDFFKGSGILTKNVILTLAALLVALGIISGYFKVFLAWVGFQQVAQIIK